MLFCRKPPGISDQSPIRMVPATLTQCRHTIFVRLLQLPMDSRHQASVIMIMDTKLIFTVDLTKTKYALAMRELFLP